MMQVTTILSYLVYPGKNPSERLDCPGVKLALSGILYTKLSEVFHKSDRECTIPIRFVMADDGSPKNAVRSSIVACLDSPCLRAGRVLANRLRDMTDNRPGLGLFFLIIGQDGSTQKIVLSRFPAEQGILAMEKRAALKIEYIKRIFMKNTVYYKAAVYKGTSLDADFWSGYAIDRQLDYNQLADYWIRDFLASDFKTTSKTGTRRLALALKNASHSAIPLGVKQELVAAITLAKNMFGRSTSVSKFIQQLQLSDDAKTSIVAELPTQELLDDTFILDRDEFLSNAPMKSIELDVGSILIAPADRFEDVIQRKQIGQEVGRYQFTTEGRIVDERLRGSK